MDMESLVVENPWHADVDHESNEIALLPAFMNSEDGEIELARMRNGQPALEHLIEWLPIEWADVIEMDGAIRELRPGIIAGYVKNGLFISKS